MKWRHFAGLLIYACSAASVEAAVFYDASTKRIAPGSGLAYFYNPGIDNGGQSGHILFDDVTVLSSLPIAVFQVTKVTVGISRAAGAPAVQIAPYYAQFLPDAVRSGGVYDGTFSDPLYAQAFAAPIARSANGSTFVDGETLTFGDGVSTLFSVASHAPNPASAYRSFAIGLKFSTTDNQNGWTVAQQSSSLDVLWDYLNDSNFSEFTYGQDSSGLIAGTQCLRVEGSVVAGLPADANFDGKVDASDLGLLAQHWQQPGTFATGDFSFDGFVDIRDLAILAGNWQSGAGSLSAALASLSLPTSTVPEPTGPCLLLLVGAIGLLRRR